MHPFEKALHTYTSSDWYSRRILLLTRVSSYEVPFIKSFKDYPPSQKPAMWEC